MAFVVPGTYGRIELDVEGGRVVSARFVESIRTPKALDTGRRA